LRTGYLDQIAVAPEAWGSPAARVLLGAAKAIAPSGLDLRVTHDNARAIRFYEKHGFAVSGEEVNPRSGAPIYEMKLAIMTLGKLRSPCKGPARVPTAIEHFSSKRCIVTPNCLASGSTGFSVHRNRQPWCHRQAALGQWPVLFRL
jgi:hypothetical protein